MSDHPHPPRPPEPPSDVSADALHALAAGELEAEEARALGARIDAEPALARRYAAVAEVEGALRRLTAEEPPAELIGRVLDGLPTGRHQVSWPALGRLAAAVVVALGAWIVAFGSAPGMAHADPAIAEAIQPALRLVPAEPLPVPVLGLEPTDALASAPGLLALAGVVVLAFGLRLASRVYAHGRTRPEAGKETS